MSSQHPNSAPSSNPLFPSSGASSNQPQQQPQQSLPSLPRIAHPHHPQSFPLSAPTNQLSGLGQQAMSAQSGSLPSQPDFPSQQQISSGPQLLPAMNTFALHQLPQQQSQQSGGPAQHVMAAPGLAPNPNLPGGAGAGRQQQVLPQGFRPLNVRDALTYLDQVKVQFADQPDVYNRFLDIMKDFKSQAIDTPGVIERVSALFRGHHNLIVGFNTFLPPGYKIELNPDQSSGATTYTITTPENMQSHIQQHQMVHHNLMHPHQPSVVPSQQQWYPGGPSINGAQFQPRPVDQQLSGFPNTAFPQGELHPGATHPPPFGQPYHPARAAPIQPLSQNVQPPQISQPALQQSLSQHGTSHPVQAVLSQQSRVQNIPDISDAGVKKPPVEFNHAINYVNKIKNRFANEPEIYRQFLEILRTYQNDSKPIAEVYAQMQILFKSAPDLLEEFHQFLPESPAINNSLPSVTANQRGSQVGSKKSSSQSKLGAINKLKRPGAPIYGLISKSRFDPVARLHASEEFDFFEKVKRALGNKTTYSEFLKVLNLFNQDIIDPKMLVEKVEPFLARTPELLDWFKAYVRYDDRDEEIAIVGVEVPKNLSGAKRSGSSYRLLPSDYQQASCSGRDQLCEEVLNDNWVCHPTWASEDGGFVAHKKNQFEDALYRCEEERYEFDLNIETNRSVIQRLEPIARRIAEMTPDEQRSFKLPDGLGDGFSKTIYKRVIKKIYDSERGLEVIEALHEAPAVTIPILLKRLKQKDEEWRRSQREWNRVWREIDARNFYKSLDHQGINFKTTDKKSLTSKSLIMEIETLYRERHEKPSATDPKWHLELSFGDSAIQADIERLIYSYLEKASQFSADDVERVRSFLKNLLLELRLIQPQNAMAIDPKEKTATMFGNSTFYLFLRLYGLAYNRLISIRTCAENIDSVPVGYSRMKYQSLPDSLDLTTKKENSTDVESGNIYEGTLSLIEKFFDNEIDVNAFEDQTRFWYGASAYVTYTSDKLFHSLCKHLVQLVSDPKSSTLFALLQKFSSNSISFTESQYRQKSDELVEEEENLYRFEYDPATKRLSIELLGDVDSSNLDPNATQELRWSDYIDNYVKQPVTSGLYKPRNPVFLKRLLGKTNPEAQHISQNNLECKICINTYKMFFVEHTEDFYRRLVPKVKMDSVVKGNIARHTVFNEWLEGPSGWAKNTSPEQRKSLSNSCDEFYTKGAALSGETSGIFRSSTIVSTRKETIERCGISCTRFFTDDQLISPSNSNPSQQQTNAATSRSSRNRH